MTFFFSLETFFFFLKEDFFRKIPSRKKKSFFSEIKRRKNRMNPFFPPKMFFEQHTPYTPTSISTPLVNPVTGIPLFYGDVNPIRIDPQNPDLPPDDPKQFVVGFTIRVIVWQEGHIEEYFSASNEAILKWNTTLEHAMTKHGFDIIIISLDGSKPLLKSTFTEKMDFTIPQFAPEISCKTLMNLAREVDFRALDKSRIKYIHYESEPHYRRNVRGQMGHSISKESVPLFMCYSENNQFTLEIKKGIPVAKRDHKKKWEKLQPEIYEKKEGKQEEEKGEEKKEKEGKQEEEKGEEKKEKELSSLRSSGKNSKN
jgi:hypothetical protein